MDTSTLSPGTRRALRPGRLGISAAVGATLLGAGLAACSSSSSSPSTPTTAAPTTAMSSSSVNPSASGAALKTASNATLGTILVDANGKTLYRFDADSANPPTSHCTGSCASVWPPVPAGSGLTAQGFAQSELGTITRSDGTKQVTVDGWPVYTYTGDSAAGQANGQKLNVNGGTWWAVTTTGARASASPGAPTSASASATSGVHY